MDDNWVAPIAAWVTRVGLAGMTELDLLRGFCERAVAAGLPLVARDSSSSTRCTRSTRAASSAGGATEPDERQMIEYGRTNEGEAAESWRRSPFYHLLETGGVDAAALLRSRRPRRLSRDLRELAERGRDRLPRADPPLRGRRRHRRDGLRLLVLDHRRAGRLRDARRRGAARARAGRSRWRSNAPRSARIAETLVETYLGRDAGRRVLARPHRARRRRPHQRRALVLATCAATPPSPTAAAAGARSSRCSTTTPRR